MALTMSDSWSSSSVDLRTQELDSKSLRSDLWGTLHVSVVEKVLAKLPFSSLLRFCCVCKSWRNAILSSHISTPSSAGQERLVYFHKGKLTFHNSRGLRESVPLAFDVDELRIGSLYVAASGGGLLCFHDYGVFEQFIIFNPVTKCSKRLQIPCRESETQSKHEKTPARQWKTYGRIISLDLLVGIVHNSATGYFKLIVSALFERSPRLIHIYDSCSDSWKVSDFLQDGIKKISFRMKPVACNGNLYCSISCSRENDEFVEERLVMYDSEQETWSWIQFKESSWTTALKEAFPRYFHKDTSFIHSRPKLIEHNGKVLLMIKPRRTQRQFVFFELQDSCFRLWRSANLPTLARVCEEMSLGSIIPAIVAPYVLVECMGQGGVMCFLGVRMGTFKIWIHDLLTNSHVLSDWEEGGDDYHVDSYSMLKPSFIIP